MIALEFQTTQLKAKLERINQNLVSGKGQKRVLSQLEKTLNKAKSRTPVATGALRSSGRLQVQNSRRATYDWNIIFGGPSARYAIYVHEILSNYHPVGQAKFLESAVAEDEGAIRAAVADAIAEALGGGR